MTLSRIDSSEKLIDILKNLHGATSSGTDNSTKEQLYKEFYALLDEMSLNLLPYSAASQFIYSNINGEGFYFIETIEEKIVTDIDDKDPKYTKGLKIVEHLELALQQKESLFAKQEKKIEEDRKIQAELLEKAEKIKDLQAITENLQNQNNKMITNFITILGIFAAILMGAFGSIQGFNSLFDNAAFLNLGKLLIVSSIGASSILLILFFLLNGIAKLTDRSLSSATKKGATLLEKHPTLVITHGLLIFISLIGASLELSNVKIEIAWQAIWWLMPIAWIVYFLIAYNKKSWFPSFKKSKSNLNSEDEEAV